MAYESRLPPGLVVFDDSTREHELPDDQQPGGRGLRMPAGRAAMGYAYQSIATPFPRELIIEPGPSQSNWKDRIKQMEDAGNTVEEELRRVGLDPLDQERTNYCWGNGPVGLVEAWYVRQGQLDPETGKPIRLSPASVCARVTNFQNRGGWGADALEHLISKGCNTQADWPPNAIDPRYDTPETRQRALLNRVTGWFTGKPRDYVEHISMIFHAMASVGLDYWGHQVDDYRPIILEDEVLPLSRNSWGRDYPKPGAGGWFVRRGNKKFADDIVCIAGVSAA